LGVRDRDVRLDADRVVRPGTGGMSVTPNDPKHLPAEFLPEALGGFGRLPLYSIKTTELGEELVARLDPRKPDRHAFVEPAAPMQVGDFQHALCSTAASWTRWSS
jgi:hypothetical protein